MTMKRGDVALAWYPFSSRSGGKRRPCLVIQNDIDNARLSNTIVVQITSNLRSRGQSTAHLIEASSAAGRQSGLLHDSIVSCINVATIEQSLIATIIGSLPPEEMAAIEDGPGAAMEL